MSIELIENGKEKTMKGAIFALRSIVLLLAVLLVTATPAAAVEQMELIRNDMAPAGPDIIDGTYMLGDKEMALRKQAALVGAAAATNASPIGLPAAVGEELAITIADFGMGVQYSETFVVVMDGTHGIILIEKAAYENYDPINDEYLFPNPYHGTYDRISTEKLSYMLDQFDTNIYPTDTTIYGEPLARGDEGRKVWILIHNIRDRMYYDPTQTSYVAGYFSAGEDAASNKNMIHIDSYDWANRTGPDSARPYLYEGVFAHEFEHLIHFDRDPDEPSWVDEGLADLAGFMCGYGHSSGHIAYYMVYHPMVSLTFWGGGLEDYGASYLFALYLYEQFGGAEFVSALVREQANGIEGIEKTLAAFGHKETFDEVFDNWTVANYLDEGSGKYGYESLALGTMDTWGYSIEYALSYMWFGPPLAAPFGIPSYWFQGIEPQPYTAHYFRFTNDTAADVFINGDDFCGVTAYSGDYEWHSGAEAWAWNSFSQTFSIPAGGATLSFYTCFDIEYNWDYGYVEVYDHDTGKWCTLDAPGTVDYVAYAQDNPAVPDGREPTDYEAAGCWHAFTGSSGGWVPVSMDLSPFAGHTIDIHFRTWQDGAFTLQMMYVDDISIPEIGFFDDVEAGEDGWTAGGWCRTDGKLENGFSVTTIDTKWVPTARYPLPAGNSATSLHGIRNMTVDPDTQSGLDRIPATPADSGRIQVSIVSNHAKHIQAAHYLFWVK